MNPMTVIIQPGFRASDTIIDPDGYRAGATPLDPPPGVATSIDPSGGIVRALPEGASDGHDPWEEQA